MIGTTAVEIRQPHSLPQVFNVPNSYPRLAELEAQHKKVSAEAETLGSTLDSLSQEKNSLDRESASITATGETFARVAEVTNELRRLAFQHANAVAHAKRVSDELAEVRYEFAWHFYRRQLLNAELAQAGKLPEMRMLEPGEKQSRSRLEILKELDQCVSWLAVWSCDAKLIDEARAIKAKLSEAWQQV